ncbi:HAD family hydrolase [Micromonospora sp. WMMD1082]|uniref:HAD family hydrolase n=1 Tax=Micromonospora sp. WMMD1082 TaxID=3016104 RepID=UPI0024167077|nr:HAD family hydrolase [Micromonospora sp. WMMD1082]MDG4798055.1 HAD hydrolase-like protein [Micromonospora sp. WMMD1082]
MKLFVWDLHGVLEEGNDRAVIDISNEVLAAFGYEQRFAYADGRRLYGHKWYEYFSFLLPEDTHDRHMELQEACFMVSEERPELQYRWMRPTPHAIDVLAEIGARHQQIVISNTRPGTLDMFLKLLELTDYFVPGRAFAVDQHVRDVKTTKKDILAEYLAGKPAFEEIVIIGDSASDMLLADVAGGTTYLFAHPEFAFRNCTADFRIHDLREVLGRV